MEGKVASTRFPGLAALSLAQGAPMWTTRALRRRVNRIVTLNDTPDTHKLTMMDHL